MELPPGSRIDRYTIRALAGKGGMGEVYRAHDPRLGRQVAIKVLPESLARDADALARFEREARAIAALSHPNILAIYDVGRDGDTPFAVMELLEGQTLRARLLESQPSWRKAVEIAIGIADGLAAAHSKGVVHRDLKPENVFLLAGDRVKILDFGLARFDAPAPAAEDDAPTETVHTDTDTVRGTVPYMSPEQVRGAAVGAASDIFSFGSVLYEMTTGERAFSRETPAETMVAILKEDPPMPAGTGRSAPQSLWDLLHHCLEKSPDARFVSAGDLAFTLRTIARDASAQSLSAPAPAAKPTPSVAVLPFLDMSPEKDQEYFCDGLAEELIGALAKLEGLQVASRTAAFRFQGKGQDLHAIGEALKVETILEGSVRKAASRLRITAQLVKVRDGYPLWSEKYDRELSDVFAIQEEIARSIAATLKVRLLGEDALVAPHTRNAEAYNLYLKGRFFWNKRYQVGVEKGVEYFRRAVEADSDYALAYTGLADSYTILGFYGNVAPEEARREARAAATRALALDDRLPESHVSAGFLAAWFDWNLEETDREFRRAIELNPRHYWAHSWYGIALAGWGRHTDSEREVLEARAIDPLAMTNGPPMGFLYQSAGRFDDAIADCHKTLDLDPDQLLALWISGISYSHLGRHEEAIAALERATRVTRDTYYAGCLGYAYGRAGREADARRILDELMARSAAEYVAPVFFTWIHGALGEIDRAYEFLEKAFAERHPLVVPLRAWKVYDGLRGDPRFSEYAARIRP
ncbi:MAG TPA: protein kinase [Thermoanaerobaculia bacterium]|nr:protein kinase [Thermoanaerobaculia bacterium]